MNLCIPVRDDRGLSSPVHAHFGSAPIFLVVDTATRSCRAIPNDSAHHRHGACTPLAALAGERIDGAVVGGIGAGALGKLAAAGIRVYLAEHATVAEAVAAFEAGALRLVGPELACAGHGHSHS